MAGSLLMLFGQPVRACTNDSDCPNATCGGDICNWYPPEANVCRPAGLHPAGQDGWCTVDADCKCQAQGARCVGTQCSFTTPASPPPAGGGCSFGGARPVPGPVAVLVLVAVLVPRRVRRP